MSDASDRPVPAVPAQVATQSACQCGHPRSVHVEEVGPCHNPAACFCAEFRYNVPADEFQEKAAAATGIGATPATRDEIPRYNVYRALGFVKMIEAEHGLWIKYSDHASALRAVREERDRLVEIIKEQDKTVMYEFRRYKAEREARKQAEEALLKLHTLRPLEEYHEDYGCVLWHHLPIQEPPHVGSPLDSDWDDHQGYYTHWSPIPMNPEVAKPVQEPVAVPTGLAPSETAGEPHE